MYEDGAFCPDCGIALQEINDIAGNEVVINEPLKKEYRFKKTTFSGSEIITDIIINGLNMNIKQKKKCLFFSYGEQEVNLSVNEITDVMKKKGLSYEGLAIFLGGLLLVVSGANFVAWAIMIAGLFLIRSTYLYLYYRNGYVKIPKEVSLNNDIDEIVKYIQYHNPDAVKITLDK